MDPNPNSRFSQEEKRAEGATKIASKTQKLTNDIAGPQTREEQFVSDAVGYRTLLPKNKREQVRGAYQQYEKTRQEVNQLSQAQRLRDALIQWGPKYFDAKETVERLNFNQSLLDNLNLSSPPEGSIEQQVYLKNKQNLEKDIAEDSERYNALHFAREIERREKMLLEKFGIRFNSLEGQVVNSAYNLGLHNLALGDKTGTMSRLLTNAADYVGLSEDQLLQASRIITEIQMIGSALDATNDYLDDGWGNQFMDGALKGLLGDAVGKRARMRDELHVYESRLNELDTKNPKIKDSFNLTERLDPKDYGTFYSHIDLADQNAVVRGGDENMLAQGLGYSIGALPMFWLGLGTKMFDVKKLGSEWFKMLFMSPFKTGGPRFAGDLMQATKEGDVNTLQDVLMFMGKSYWENLTENVGELSTPLIARALPKISTAYSKFLNRLGGKLGRFTDYTVVATGTEMLEEEISSLLQGEDSIFTGNFDVKRLAHLAFTTGIMGLGFATVGTMHKRAYIKALDAKLGENPELKSKLLGSKSLWDLSDEQLDNVSKQAGVVMGLKEQWNHIKDSVNDIQAQLSQQDNPMLNRAEMTLQQVKSQLTTELEQEIGRLAEDTLYQFDGESMMRDVKEDLDVVQKDLDMYNTYMEDIHMKDVQKFNEAKTLDMNQLNSARSRVNASAGTEVLTLVQESDYVNMSPVEYQEFRNNLIDETYQAASKQSESIKFYSGSQEREYTPENIQSLKENEVFVFGSNAEGRHGAGAAKIAFEKFGAVPGTSTGEKGQSYAIVTKKDWKKPKSSSLPEIRAGIANFIRHAKKNPNKKYYVTKIGSGLGGYTTQEIGSLFHAVHKSGEDIPDNVILPKEYDPRGTTPITTKTESSTPSESVTNFKEDQSDGYRERTITNAKSDVTIAFAVDFSIAGEKLTKSSVIKQGKKYIPIDANSLTITKERVEKVVEILNSVNAKTLNISGNGIYTMKSKYTQSQVDEFTYNFLSQVLSHPDLKNKIVKINSGGQTGFDEAGIKAGKRLGIPTVVLAPKGWKFRNKDGIDISNEKLFKERFNVPSKNVTNYKGGFNPNGKGTPEGDGKDKAMREVATAFIGEVVNENGKTSTNTSANIIYNKLSNGQKSLIGKSTISVWNETGDSGSIVMLARNSEFRNKPLTNDTKIEIDTSHSNGSTFIVGDMPGVDEQFVEYLNAIGAKYTVYGTGLTPRFNIPSSNVTSAKGQTAESKSLQTVQEQLIADPSVNAQNKELLKALEGRDTDDTQVEKVESLDDAQGFRMTIINALDRAFTSNLKSLPPFSYRADISPESLLELKNVDFTSAEDTYRFLEKWVYDNISLPKGSTYTWELYTQRKREILDEQHEEEGNHYDRSFIDPSPASHMDALMFYINKAIREIEPVVRKVQTVYQNALSNEIYERIKLNPAFKLFNEEQLRDVSTIRVGRYTDEEIREAEQYGFDTDGYYLAVPAKTMSLNDIGILMLYDKTKMSFEEWASRNRESERFPAEMDPRRLSGVSHEDIAHEMIDAAIDELPRYLYNIQKDVENGIVPPKFEVRFNIQNTAAFYDLVENKIKVLKDNWSKLSSNEKATVLNHETIHKYTVQGLIQPDEVGHNENLYNANFRNAIKGLYEATKDQLPSYITNPAPINGMSIETVQLAEFVSYGMTDKKVQEILAKTPYGKAKQMNTWRAFLKAIQDFLKTITGYNTFKQFGESALNNLMVEVSDYIDKYHPKLTRPDTQLEHNNNQANANLAETSGNTGKDDFTANHAGLTSSKSTHESDRKLVDQTLTNYEVHSNIPTSKFLNEEFLNRDGNPIYGSTQQMLDDIKRFRGESNYNDELAFVEWKNSVIGRFDEEEALNSLDKVQIKKNLLTHLENVWLNLKGLTNHKVAYFNGKSLSIHSGTYPDYTFDKDGEILNEESKSTVYKKQFYEYDIDLINARHGLNLEAIELSPQSKIDDTTVPELVKKGYIVQYNKGTVVLIKHSSLPNSIPGIDLQKMTPDELNQYNTDRWLDYYRLLFGKGISEQALIKRIPFHSGNAPNTFISEFVMEQLSNKYGVSWGPSAPIHYDSKTGALNVRTVQFDVGPEMIPYLKEMLGEDYKDEIVGDGAIYSLPIVHDTYNMINGVSIDDWAISNKYKTFHIEEQLLKAADQTVPKDSPLANWMKKHNVGKVIFSSARKIKSSTEHGKEQTSTWNDIVNDISPKHIYTYNMRDDAFVSSHGHVKQEIRGVSPSFFTVMLTSYMDKDTLKALTEHLNSRFDSLYDTVLVNVNDTDFISKKLREFMENNEDMFVSATQEFIENNIDKNPNIAYLLPVLDYFKQNILQQELRDALGRQEELGIYPILMADVGELSGYRSQARKWLKEHMKYSDEQVEKVLNDAFDEKGFIKPGYVMIDRSNYETFEKHMTPGELPRILLSGNPPASYADIRAVTVIGVIPNRRLQVERNGVKINSIIDRNGMVVNIRDWQAISGKDFDIDKLGGIPIISGKPIEKVWDFLSKFDGTNKIKRIRSKFQESYDSYAIDSPDIIEHEIDLDKMQSTIGFQVKGFDKALAHLVRLYGYNGKFKKLKLSNGYQATQIGLMMKSMLIGEVYNSRLFYSLVSEIGGEFTIKTDKATYKIKINPQNEDRNIGLLDALTNVTLDWSSDQKLLAFNYNNDRTTELLYDVYELKNGKFEQVFGEDAKVAWAGNKIPIPAYAYIKLVRPVRSLLKSNDLPEHKTLQNYAVLMDMLKVAHKDLFDSGTNPSKLQTNKTNPFWNTVLFHSTRHFFKRYLQSPIGTIGLTDQEWKKIMSKVSSKMTTDEEKKIMHDQESIPHLMARFMNRLYSINRRNIEFTDLSGGKDGPAGSDQQNGMGGLLEMSNIIHRLKAKKVNTEVFERGFVRMVRNIINSGLLRNPTFTKKLLLIDGAKDNNQRWEIKPVDGNLTFKRVTVIGGKDTEIKEYETFDDMFNDTGNYSIEKAIVNMSITKSDGGYFSLTAFQKMFKIRNNNSLSKPLASIVKEMYADLIPSYVLTEMTTVERKAFIKSGFGLYDSDANLSQGLRFVISYKQKSQSVTEDRVVKRTEWNEYTKAFNMMYSNPTSYVAFLDPYKDKSADIQEIYDTFMDTFIDESVFNVEARKNAQSKGLLTPIRFYSHNPNVTLPEDSNDAPLSVYKKDIADLTDTILAQDGTKPHQIVDFWNQNNTKNKIGQTEIKDEHKLFYAKFLAESFFNFKISFEKTSKHKKQYNVMKTALKMFAKAQRDPEALRYTKSYSLGKFLPAQWYLKRMSSKTILMQPGERVIYMFNGEPHYISGFEIGRSFDELVHPDEPYMVSGAMIAQEIMRRLNWGFNDNIHTMEKIGASVIDVLHEENPFISSTPVGKIPGKKKDIPYVLGKRFQATVYDIAEFGLEKLTVLSSDGTMIYNLKKYDIIERPGPTPTTLTGGTLEKFEVPRWNKKVLTELATTIAMANYVPKATNTTEVTNYEKAMLIRQYMSAIMQRYIYDYYAAALIDVQSQNLSYLSRHAGRMSPHIAYAVKSMIDGPNGFLEKLERMKKQMQLKSANLSKSGKKYMPRVFADSKMYEKGIYEAEKKTNDALPKGHKDKLTDAQLKAKVKSIVDAKTKQADRFGYPKELLNTNFFERERDDIGYYRKDPMVTGDYLSMLMLTFRHDFMSAYDYMYEEYTQYDNEQMQQEIRHQAAIVRTQNAYYTPTEFDALKKNKSVEFIWRGFVKPGITNPPGTVINGEVKSINFKTGEATIKLNKPIYHPVLKSNIEEIDVKKNEMINLREIQPLTHARKLDYFIYNLTGSDIDVNEKSQVLGKWLVSMRNYSMLTMKVSYAPRNKFGSRMNRWAMFGTNKSLREDMAIIQAKYDRFQAMKKDLTKTEEDIAAEFTSVDLATFNMLFEESTAVFGEVDELMGRFGADIKQMEKLSAEQIALYNKLDMQWTKVRDELKPLYDKIVGTPNEIGQPDRWTDGKWEFLQKTLGANGSAFMEFMFKGYHLYNPAAIVTSALFGNPMSEYLNASTVEKGNRIESVMKAVAFYNSMFQDADMSEREKEIFRGLMTDIAMALYKEAVINTDFLYQPGLDLSHWDSTIWGRFWLQFSHYGNMTTNVYFDKLLGMSKQFKQHGMLEVVLGPNKMSYICRLRDIKTGEVLEKKFHDVNQFRQFFRMTWGSVFVGAIREFARAIGSLGIKVIAGAAIWDIISMATTLVVSDSLTVAPTTPLIHCIGWILEAWGLGFGDLGPDDEPVSEEDRERMNADIKKVYFTIPIIDKDVTRHGAKRIWAEIFGESKDEFVRYETWRLNVKAQSEGWTKEERESITPEMLGAKWELAQRQKERSMIPVMGVAMAQMHDFIMATALGYMEALGHFEMMTSVASTQVPVFQVILPFVQSFRPDVGFKRSQAQTLEYEIARRYELLEVRERRVDNEIDLLTYNRNLITPRYTEGSFKPKEEKIEEKERYLEFLKKTGWRSPEYQMDSLTSRVYGFRRDNQIDSAKREAIDYKSYFQSLEDSTYAEMTWQILLNDTTETNLPHLMSQIFIDSLINAPAEVRLKFLNEINEKIVKNVNNRPSEKRLDDQERSIESQAPNP